MREGDLGQTRSSNSLRPELFQLRARASRASRYSKPQRVGNRIKDKECWDTLYMTLKD